MFVNTWRLSIISSLITLLASGVYFLYFYSDGVADKKNDEMNDEYRFIKVNCWFDADWKADITCGELHTPAQQGKFVLPVVILHAEYQPAQSDPVLYLPGGPGASAGLHTEGIKRWLNWMRLAGTQRDLILMDTRGTGRSSPRLECPEYNRFNHQLMRENTSLEEELRLSYEVTARCFDEAFKNNSALDYRRFGTHVSAQDIRALMSKLNYVQWNILGVSYGTRLALEIARQEQESPQRVQLKSMVLDSLYPAGFGGVQTWPEVLDDAVQKFIKGCARQVTCSRSEAIKEQELQVLLLSALARLRDSPMEITVKRWDGEAPLYWLVNDHRFLSMIFAGIYDPHDWPKIVDAINGVHQGRSESLKPLAEPYLNNSVSEDFNSLTFTAVDCADNPVQAEADYLTAVAAHAMLQNYTKDQWRYQLCHHLSATRPLQLTKPGVPTLILSGAQDPITPVNWAGEFHQRWPETQWRVNESLAHSVLSTDVCLLQSLINFYNQPEQAFSGCTSLAQAAQ